MLFPKNIGVVIPAYKAEKELNRFFPILLEFVPNEQITVLIDGDLDNTKIVCEEFGVTYIVHKENRGKGAALQTLFENSSPKYTWLISMDADGQHLPSELHLFLEAINKCPENCALILGARDRKGTDMPFLRRFSNGITSNFISLVTTSTVKDVQSGYRAYRSDVVANITCKSTRFDMETEIIIRIIQSGYSIDNVTISTVYNDEESHISHFLDTFRWIKTVLYTLLSKGKMDE